MKTQMTTRDAFEAWIRTAKTWKGDEILFNRDDCGLYQLNTVQATFDAWHAATFFERERCALVSEAISEKARRDYEENVLPGSRHDPYTDGVSDGAGSCADAIRSGRSA